MEFTPVTWVINSESGLHPIQNSFYCYVTIRPLWVPLMLLLMIDSIVPFYSPEYVSKYTALKAVLGQELVWTKECMFLYTVSSSLTFCYNFIKQNYKSQNNALRNNLIHDKNVCLNEMIWALCH